MEKFIFCAVTELGLHSTIWTKSSLKGYYTYKDLDSCNEIGYINSLNPKVDIISYRKQKIGIKPAFFPVSHVSEALKSDLEKIYAKSINF